MEADRSEQLRRGSRAHSISAGAPPPEVEWSVVVPADPLPGGESTSESERRSFAVDPLGLEQTDPGFGQGSTESLARPRYRPAARWRATTRRRNRTFQAGGCPALPVLKTGWATRPVPRRR